MVRDKADYQDLGPDYYLRRDSARVAERLARRIRELGYAVEIHKAAWHVARPLCGFGRERVGNVECHSPAAMSESAGPRGDLEV